MLLAFKQAVAAAMAVVLRAAGTPSNKLHCTPPAPQSCCGCLYSLLAACVYVWRTFSVCLGIPNHMTFLKCTRTCVLETLSETLLRTFACTRRTQEVPA